MSFNAENQYTGSHKVWDHIGNIVPPVEHSEGMRPHHEFKPAPWLPVQFYDKHYEVWFTIMPGKVVALDPDGYVMPAQYGRGDSAAGTNISVVYTQNDVDAGVIDISTGAALTTTKTVRLDNLTGTRGSGWTAANAGVSVTSGFMGKEGVAFWPATGTEDSVRYPIGVAPQPYVQWAGGDGSNPANFRQHNHILQHQVPVLCDYVLKLPYVPTQTASETVNKTTSGTLAFGTTGTHTRTQAVANATGRYNATTGEVPVLSTYPVIALALNRYPVAQITERTLITLASDDATDDVSDVLVNERSSLSAVKAAGDYFVDSVVGVIFIYSADGSTVPASVSGASGTVSVTYYQYETANAGNISRFAQIVGAQVQPGDFLICDNNSNLAVSNSADFKLIVGQVIGFSAGPDEGLSKVRTAYKPNIGTDASGAMSLGTLSSASANIGQLDQMPGSATAGYTDLIHYAGAANLTAIVNLVSR